MIPVVPQPEPATFNQKVREPGKAELKKLTDLGFDLDKSLPTGQTLNNHWVKCMPDLHTAYNGICAYLAVRFEQDGCHVEHYLPQKHQPKLAYEWSNYRLACAGINGRKSSRLTILDPFQIESHYFYLDLFTGRIFANPSLNDELLTSQITDTILQLGLDLRHNRIMRRDRYLRFWRDVQKYPEATECCKDILKREAPHIALEAERQGWPKPI